MQEPANNENPPQAPPSIALHEKNLYTNEVNTAFKG